VELNHKCTSIFKINQMSMLSDNLVQWLWLWQYCEQIVRDLVGLIVYTLSPVNNELGYSRHQGNLASVSRQSCRIVLPRGCYLNPGYNNKKYVVKTLVCYSRSRCYLVRYITMLLVFSTLFFKVQVLVSINCLHVVF